MYILKQEFYPTVNNFNSDFSLYKNVCTHYGIPYCTRMEGTRSVKIGLMMVARATETCCH